MLAAENFRGLVMKLLLLAGLVLVWNASAGFAAGPFDAPSPLPYHAPQFDKIKDSDYAPAFAQGIKEQQAEIDAIAGNSAAPTFENTIVAMEKSGRMLDRVSETFFNVQQANTDPALDKVQSDVAPLLAAHQDAIYLNAKLFARVKAVYDARASLKLDAGSAAASHHLLSPVPACRRQSFRCRQNASCATSTSATPAWKPRFEQKLVAATKAGALVLDNKAAAGGTERRPDRHRRA